MSNLKFITIFVLSTLYIDIAFVQAQTSPIQPSPIRPRRDKFGRYWRVGLVVGTANYLGDLAPSSSPFSVDIGSTRMGIGVSLIRKLSRRVSTRAQLNYILLRGSDPDPKSISTDDFSVIGRASRNLHFRNNMLEFSISGIFDIVGNQLDYYHRPFIPILYFTLGIGVIAHNPQAKTPDEVRNGFDNEWVSLRSLNTEKDKNYGNIALIIPFGAGVRVKINDDINVNAEIGFRWTFTDYLDDVSDGVYIDPPSSMGEQATNLDWRLSYRATEKTDALTKETHSSRFRDGDPSNVTGVTTKISRGNDKLDHYFSTSFGISYILPKFSRKR